MFAFASFFEYFHRGYLMKIVEKLTKTNDFSWGLPYENCQIKAKIDEFSQGSNFEFDWKVRVATKFLKHLHNHCCATVPEVLLDIDWRPSHGSTLNDFINSYNEFLAINTY